MRTVQLQHIEARAFPAPRRVDELVAHVVHISARHRHRRRVFIRPGNIRGRNQRPVAGQEGAVHAFPWHARRALGAAMAELEAEPGFGVLMHEANDALPHRLLRVVPQSGAGGRDAPFGRDTGHLV